MRSLAVERGVTRSTTRARTPPPPRRGRGQVRDDSRTQGNSAGPPRAGGRAGGCVWAGWGGRGESLLGIMIFQNGGSKVSPAHVSLVLCDKTTVSDIGSPIVLFFINRDPRFAGICTDAPLC
jgi:hypothetical protein